ncbi:BRCA1-associated protein-like [Amphiura filiformis]|uniref:BRCA1-associated protein-like n=1 Tax=Amphiura filiformis TaxID=82378 RepID=UPI003B225C69
MSVSLVVLRIEVQDDSPIPFAVLYQSAACTIKMSASQDKQGDQIGGAESALPDNNSFSASNKMEEDKDQSLEGQIQEHTGQRQMGDIRIETFTIKHLEGDTKEPTDEPKPLQDMPEDQTKNKETITKEEEQNSSKETLSSNKDTVVKSEHPHKAPGTKSKKIYSPSGSGSSVSSSGSLSESRKHAYKSIGGRVSGKSYAAIVSNKEEVPVGPSRFHHSDGPGTSGSSGGFVQQLPSEFDEDDTPGPACSSPAPHDGGDRGSLSRIPNKLSFYSGNPSVEITKGILHLFKENEMTSLDRDEIRSEMLCMLAVPASMTVHDLLQFTAPLSQGIELMRIIRDSTQNQYMVLIKYKQQADADDFYNEFNGKPFNSIENPVCYLVYVSKVECMKAEEGACLPVPGLTELPTCHICLERMDESVDGILTILCNHSFHGNCLDQWSDTSCPVCRYCQTPELVEDHKCFVCGSQESLWICLICGHVGCGRYVEAHAYSHFEDTQHTYSMQLGNQRVWDYAGDNYVHRLVQTKGDGKPIEWNRTSGESSHEEKLDSLQLEYTYLLTSQLESQRTYFEDKMACMEQEALDRISEVEARSKKTVEELERMERSMQAMSAAVKEKVALEKKCNQLSSKLNRVNTQLKEEKQLNKCLVENQHGWQEKLNAMETKLDEDSKKKDAEIHDLKEQLRDVMFFLDAQQKINETSEDTRQEIQEGQILVGAAAPDPAKAHRKGRKKGR